ncbi:VOC family protein [Nocardia asteroides]|uniref:VOC family protein n=1 Tax=Nocardia asteroides TaxID=1824 RepID=UPI001E4D78D0|nr:VOC family protein [Nocardia asteroides]UGT64963.1 VOC family protein [Nocardia asteroides]
MDIYLLRRDTQLPPLVIALPTADRRRAVAFHRAALALEPFGELADDGVPEPLRYRLDARTTLVLIPTGGFGWVLGDRATADPGTSECLLALTLPTEAEVVATLDRARAAGATVITEPAAQPWGFTATFADPDGHVWQLTVPS